jgi:hypothetical protein
MTGQGIQLPVHVGFPGPTPLAELVKFALQCGVAVSRSSLVKNVGSMTNLARLATTPDEMLPGLIRRRANGRRLVQPHIYAFWWNDGHCKVVARGRGRKFYGTCGRP